MSVWPRVTHNTFGLPSAGSAAKAAASANNSSSSQTTTHHRGLQGRLPSSLTQLQQLETAYTENAVEASAAGVTLRAIGERVRDPASDDADDRPSSTSAHVLRTPGILPTPAPIAATRALPPPTTVPATATGGAAATAGTPAATPSPAAAVGAGSAGAPTGFARFMSADTAAASGPMPPPPLPPPQPARTARDTAPSDDPMERLRRALFGSSWDTTPSAATRSHGPVTPAAASASPAVDGGNDGYDDDDGDDDIDAAFYS